MSMPLIVSFSFLSHVKHLVSYTRLLFVHSCPSFFSVTLLVYHDKQFLRPQSCPFQGLDFVIVSCSFTPVLSTIFILFLVIFEIFSSFSLSNFANSPPGVWGTNITDTTGCSFLLVWLFLSFLPCWFLSQGSGTPWEARFFVVSHSCAGSLSCSCSLYHVSLPSSFLYSLALLCHLVQHFVVLLLSVLVFVDVKYSPGYFI